MSTFSKYRAALSFVGGIVVGVVVALAALQLLGYSLVDQHELGAVHEGLVGRLPILFANGEHEAARAEFVDHVLLTAQEEPTTVLGRVTARVLAQLRLGVGLGVDGDGDELEVFAVGQLALVAWTFAFFLHLGNGIRHLVWDAGRGFEKRQSRVSAWVVLVLAAVATAAYWLVLS